MKKTERKVIRYDEIRFEGDEAVLYLQDEVVDQFDLSSIFEDFLERQNRLADAGSVWNTVYEEVSE